MAEARVTIGSSILRHVRINGANSTFRVDTERIEASALKEIGSTEVDLLEVAATIFEIDGSVPRGGLARPDMGEGWRRDLAFDIPVSDTKRWLRSDTGEALQAAVGFLTEDQVRFSFRKKPDAGKREPFLNFQSEAAAFPADDVLLFSGGLDSFAGALETLATTERRVVLVTHRSAQKLVARQVRLGKWLQERFPGRVLHIHVRAHRVGPEARETTQRSRSFLFTALAQVIARSFGARRICIFENGVVSHNLPISSQVIGAMATRTTHPLALLQINALHRCLFDAPAPIENPYAWLTKKDVVEKICMHGGRSQIRDTVSCTHVREQNLLLTHCGECSQCLDRRFAILALGIGDEDPVEAYRTDVLTGKRSSDASRTMAVDWTGRALLISELDLQGFLGRFALELARIADGHPDEPDIDILRRAGELHQRHATDVVTVLAAAIVEHANALAKHLLPMTCLLVNHQAPATWPLQALSPSWPSEADANEVVDDPSDLGDPTEAPLKIRFSGDGQRFFVDVVGLTTLSGRRAQLIHHLRPAFDADRQAGIAFADYRYTPNGKLAGMMEINKNTVVQTVRRCRKEVADAFKITLGTPPKRHRLIETRSPKGYRLEVDLKVLGV